MQSETLDMEKMVIVARAIASPTRLAVLRLLGEQGCPLTTAARLMGLSASTTAHHLAVLVDAGLVTKTPRGREAIYRWSRSRWALVRMPSPAAPMPEVPEPS
jgi:DNA-binding transcriptional ArsR family regulator